MKIGYGTYGTQGIDTFEALPRIREIGYEAVELNVGDDWDTAPHKLDKEARTRLVGSLRAEDFPPPVLMVTGLAVCVRGNGRPGMRAKFDEICGLAEDLNYGENPAVIVSTLGGIGQSWEDERDWICESLLELAVRAADRNVVLAVEPHAGHIFETPEKAVWVMEQTHHDFLKLNFDISHFHVIGIDTAHSVRLCAPYSVATHVKDGRMVDGKVEFLLPGEGDLDLSLYLKAVSDAGMDVPITVEVTAQIWRKPDYDPWAAAEQSFRSLDEARRNL